MNLIENYTAIETLEVPAFLDAETSWNENELEQKAALLIARCYQLLSEMKDKRDRMKLPS
jgi:hypothetical protein